MQSHFALLKLHFALWTKTFPSNVSDYATCAFWFAAFVFKLVMNVLLCYIRFHNDSVFFPLTALYSNYMALCHMTQSTNRFLAEKWRPLQSAAGCQVNSVGHLELKESYSKAHFPTVMKKFNITTIVTKADLKAIREESFELFTAGHVHINKNRCYSKHFTAVFFITRISAKKTAKICHVHNPCILCFKRNYQKVWISFSDPLLWPPPFCIPPAFDCLIFFL